MNSNDIEVEGTLSAAVDGFRGAGPVVLTAYYRTAPQDERDGVPRIYYELEWHSPPAGLRAGAALELTCAELHTRASLVVLLTDQLAPGVARVVAGERGCVRARDAGWIDPGGNPADVLRQLLEVPAVRRYVAAKHRLPYDFEIDERAFAEAREYFDQLVDSVTGRPVGEGDR